MKIAKVEDISFKDIVYILDNSGLLILPFDTCYGISCNPSDQEAVNKLLKYKSRREGKAISITVKDIEMANKYVELNETAKNIYRRFLPGPYSIISRSKGIVATGIEAENKTLSIRIPNYKFINKLVENYNNPITSTSANQAYKKTPYSIKDILDNSDPKDLELIDLIIDAGTLPHNPPSTVMDTTLGEVQVLRKGEFLPENSKTNEFISTSESETISFARELLERFKTNLEYRPIIFALQGDLGAGKTQFTKGLAQSLGIKDQIISPTFILTREYETLSGSRLYHIDTWRLEDINDIKELGIEEMLKQRSNSNNVISIEWADKVKDYLLNLDINLKIIWVEISETSDYPDKRIIRWSE